MKTIIYGAGGLGAKALAHIRGTGCEVDCFTDSNPQKWGGAWQGKPIVAPESLRNEDCHVIIATAFEYQPIRKYLRELWSNTKPGNKISVYSIHYILEKENLPPGEDLTGLYDQEDSVNRHYCSLFARGFMRSHQLWDCDEVACLPSMDYFDGLLDPALLPELTYIDIGAFDGESVRQVTRYFKNKIIQTFAFEPLKDVFPLLQENLARWNFENNTACYPFGLGSENKYCDFSGNGEGFGMAANKAREASASAPPQNMTQVDIKTLDAMNLDIQGYPCVKMDIEGMEPEALKGMSNFIKERKPLLAMCAYHNADHEFILPAYIKSIAPDYKFYLSGGFHVVCYAIPKNLDHCRLRR